MAEQEGEPLSNAADKLNGAPAGGERDVLMAEGATESFSPAPINRASTPAGVGRTGTPARSLANGDRLESTSRAASAHPESTFVLPSSIPQSGAPVRRYINSNVTGPLLEGMKLIAKEQPQDPLRVLGEFLLERSRETEGTK